jgi:kynurenine formamidase
MNKHKHKQTNKQTYQQTQTNTYTNKHIFYKYQNVSIRGKAVLFCFGWDKYWGQQNYETHENESHPFISQQVAEYLVSEGV